MTPQIAFYSGQAEACASAAGAALLDNQRETFLRAEAAWTALAARAIRMEKARAEREAVKTAEQAVA